MVDLLRFLQRYELWIYVGLGIGALFYIQRVIAAWVEWRNALFGLERDSAQQKLSAASTILVLMALLIVIEFSVVSFVIPSIPQQAMLPTPTLDLLATPTATLSLGSPLAMAATTPTPLSTGCTPGVIEWITPKAGDSLSESTELRGTVNVPNLDFFKYEYAPVGTEEWVSIAAVDHPVIDAAIGAWNVTQLLPGDYQLRLVVTDNQNNVLPACIVQVRIVYP